MGEDSPWRDRETLRKEYVEKGKTREELAEQWDCSQGTIQYWQDKHDIERRDFGGGEKDADYRDEEVMRDLYHEQGLSMTEVAEELDCALYTIQRWFDRHDIETRQAPQQKVPHHRLKRTSSRIGGEYEQIHHSIDGEKYTITVHRLMAVAYGLLEPDEYWNNEIVIHHKSDHGLDNRPENLERMTHSDHVKHHKPWLDSPAIGEN